MPPRCILLPLVTALARPIATQESTRLLRQPTVSATHIVFAHAGEHVAFSGEYNGRADEYVVPVEGGTPTRLTGHPSTDEVQSWAPGF